MTKKSETLIKEFRIVADKFRARKAGDKMKTLSIIIPSYNTEKHIDRCVPSFLSIKEQDELEIIFVNDGSTDGTLSKLNSYKKKYPEMIKIITKQNGGHGSAVNAGIKEAEGKYFKVVDGDDWVETDGLDRLIRQLRSADADLVINPFYRVSQISGNRSLEGVRDIEKNVEIGMDDIPDNIFGLELHTWTIKSSILKENNIQLTEKCYYDDLEYITFPVPYIKSVLFLDFPVYDYLVDQAAQSVSDANVFKNYWMNKKIVFAMLRYYSDGEVNWTPRVRRYVMDNTRTAIRQHYNIYLRNRKEITAYQKLKKFDRELCREFPEVYWWIGKQYIYIRILRKGKKFTFYIISLFLGMYKFLYNKSVMVRKLFT